MSDSKNHELSLYERVARLEQQLIASEKALELARESLREESGYRQAMEVRVYTVVGILLGIVGLVMKFIQ